jgi:hypothetical protein
VRAPRRRNALRNSLLGIGNLARRFRIWRPGSAYCARKRNRLRRYGGKRSARPARISPTSKPLLKGSERIGRFPQTQNRPRQGLRVARPNDLWFHARGTPGAHVILQRDDRQEPPREDIELAAALAAGHSRARGSGKVPVDYVLRKHVRKRPDAPPGLVFYTNAQTITVEPLLSTKGSGDRKAQIPE